MSTDKTEWRWVPVEPTDAMLMEGAAHTGSVSINVKDAWRAMLAAAPAQGEAPARAPLTTGSAQLGIEARMRAAGMASLLAEILGSGALSRRGDDDLIDRVMQAIADQDAAAERAHSITAEPPADPVRERLVQALREAEAGLEFAGADKPVADGEFVPAPTLALRAVRAALAEAEGGKGC